MAATGAFWMIEVPRSPCRAFQDEAYVLHRERLIEAEPGVDGGHHLVRRPAVQHDADRIARHELNGEERDQRHAEHDEHHLAPAGRGCRRRSASAALNSGFGRPFGAAETVKLQACQSYLSSQTWFNHHQPVVRFFQFLTWS